MPKITKIPATLSRYSATPIDVPTKRKVAAYARVSTDSEEQLTSYAAQISYYTEYIKNREDWLTFVSGDNCLRVYPNNISACSTHLRGTALGIRIKTKNIKNYQTIITNARANGEDVAKGIKNAFKEASIPSRGLIY